MRIEFGYQINCSELVTHLGALALEDIIQAFAVIEDVTGWRWGGRHDRLLLRLPEERLWELLDVDQTDRDAPWLRLNAARMADLYAGRIDAKIRRQMAGCPFLRPCLSPALAERDVCSDAVDWMSASIDCECEKKGLTLSLSQHHMARQMPAFHAVRNRFGTDFEAHGGGNDTTYLGWMTHHFLDKEVVEKRLAATHVSEEEAREWSVFIGAQPPLPGASLSEADRARLISWLGPLKDEIYDDWRRYRRENARRKTAQRSQKKSRGRRDEDY